jgi:hypothetical protein
VGLSQTLGRMSIRQCVPYRQMRVARKFMRATDFFFSAVSASGSWCGNACTASESGSSSQESESLENNYGVRDNRAKDLPASAGGT